MTKGVIGNKLENECKDIAGEQVTVGLMGYVRNFNFYSEGEVRQSPSCREMTAFDSTFKGPALVLCDKQTIATQGQKQNLLRSLVQSYG